MKYYVCSAFAVIFPYLLCSINPAIIAARMKAGGDIREMGSGNPGFTNTLRTMDRSTAVTVLLCDFLKGLLSVLIVLGFCYMVMDPIPREIPFRFQPVPQMFLWIAALTAAIGHCFPVFHKLNGGKAILVTLAALCVIDIISAAILLCLFIIIVAVTKYVSLGSLIAAVLYPVCIQIIGYYVWDNVNVIVAIPFTNAISILLIFKHVNNMRRLASGTERKIGEQIQPDPGEGQSEGTETDAESQSENAEDAEKQEETNG